MDASGIRRLGNALLVVALIWPSLHLAKVVHQAYGIKSEIDKARLSCVQMARSETRDIAFRGGISFPRALTSGIRIRAEYPSGDVILTYLDSDSPPVTPWDISFQFLTVFLLTVLAMSGFYFSHNRIAILRNIGQVVLTLVALIGTGCAVGWL
jgi:hypothetical protein